MKHSRDEMYDGILTALGLSFFVWIFFPSCKATGDIHLKGKAGEIFRKVTGVEGVTFNEHSAVIATPPGEGKREQVVCHEGVHKVSAKEIADALVAIGALHDDPISRMKAWGAIYGIEYSRVGYVRENLFEGPAWEKCGGGPKSEGE